MAGQEFFTGESLLHSAGAVVVVTTVSIGFRRLAKFDTPWVPAIVALIVAYLGAGMSGALDIAKFGEFPSRQFFLSTAACIIPFANAVLLFLAAVGGTDTFAAATETKIARSRENAAVTFAERPRPAWFARWF